MSAISDLALDSYKGGVKTIQQIKDEKERKENPQTNFEKIRLEATRLEKNIHDNLKVTMAGMKVPPPPTSESNGQQANQLMQSMSHAMTAKSNLESAKATLLQTEVIESMRMAMMPNFLGKKIEVKNNSQIELDRGKLEFDYELPTDKLADDVDIRIYDGFELVKNIKGKHSVGRHSFTWDGIDDMQTKRKDGMFRVVVTATPKNKYEDPFSVTTYSQASVKSISTDGKEAFLGIGGGRTVKVSDVKTISEGENILQLQKDQLAEARELKESVQKLHAQQERSIFQGLKGLLDHEVDAVSNHFKFDPEKHEGQIPASYRVDSRVEDVQLKVRDSLGRTVFETAGTPEFGMHSFPWEGKATNGSPMPAGHYTLEAKATKTVQDSAESFIHHGFLQTDSKKMHQFDYTVPAGTTRNRLQIIDTDRNAVVYESKGITYPGEHSFRWNGQSKTGAAAPPGKYHFHMILDQHDDLPIAVRGTATRVGFGPDDNPVIGVDGHDLPLNAITALHPKGSDAKLQAAFKSLEEQHIADVTKISSKLDTMNSHQQAVLETTKAQVHAYEKTSAQLAALVEQGQSRINTIHENKTMFETLTQAVKSLHDIATGRLAQAQQSTPSQETTAPHQTVRINA